MSVDMFAKRSQMTPLSHGVRAYVAPIDRTSGTFVSRSIRPRRGSSTSTPLLLRFLTWAGYRISRASRLRNTKACAMVRMPR